MPERTDLVFFAKPNEGFADRVRNGVTEINLSFSLVWEEGRKHDPECRKTVLQLLDRYLQGILFEPVKILRHRRYRVVKRDQ